MTIKAKERKKLSLISKLFLGGGIALLAMLAIAVLFFGDTSYQLRENLVNGVLLGAGLILFGLFELGGWQLTVFLGDRGIKNARKGKQIMP